MAKLLKGIPQEFKNLPSGEEVGWKESFQAEEDALKAVEKRAIHVFRHHMADSWAVYEVVKLNPLQLRWIPYCDKWEAPDYVIRGLRPEDITRDMEWQRNWNKAVV